MKYSEKELNKLMYDAYIDARKHERNKRTQLGFEINQEDNLRQLVFEVNRRIYKPGPTICFIIKEPLTREVFAPQFRDRVVSHLLFKMISPLFERTFIHDSYSCRKEKGTLYGIQRFEHQVRSCTNNYKTEGFVLYLDISGYFMSIDKTILNKILIDTLEKFRYKKPSNVYGKCWDDVIDFDLAIYLIHGLLDRTPTDNCIRVSPLNAWIGLPPQKSLFSAKRGVGLPIGDLTSQLFSNIYLNVFDQFVKRELKCKYYCRYVDDSRIISTDKAYLISLIPKIKDFLNKELNLTIHNKKIKIVSTKQDLFFLGGHLRDYRKYPDNRSIKNFRAKVHQYEYKIQKVGGTLSKTEKEEMLSSINSFLGYFQHFKVYKKIHQTLQNSNLNTIFEFSQNYYKAKIK